MARLHRAGDERELRLRDRTGAVLFPDVVYSPHSYNGTAELGEDSRDSSIATLSNEGPGLAQAAKNLNAALWVGEYGGVEADPGIVPYMTAQYDGIGSVAGSSAYWEYGRNEAYGILDADGSEKTELLSALVRPYPERVAGDPISYAFDPMTSIFTFAYAPDAKVSAPTEVVIPSRLYPQGFHVDCGGCV